MAARVPFCFRRGVPAGTMCLPAGAARLAVGDWGMGTRTLVKWRRDRHGMPQGSGMGVLAHFHGGIRWRELIERVARVTGAGGLRSTVQAEERTVETVAIVAGSGMSYYGAACRGGADAVITGDVRYHDFHASHDRIPIIDPGHAESEVLVIDSTMEIIRNGADPDLARMIVPYAESTLPMEYLRPDGRD